MAARLIIIPLEPEAAQRARRNARHWGCRASEAATPMAGYPMLPTSLPESPRDQGSRGADPPAETWRPLRVLARYRLRWQAELAPGSGPGARLQAHEVV